MSAASASGERGSQDQDQEKKPATDQDQEKKPATNQGSSHINIKVNGVQVLINSAFVFFVKICLCLWFTKTTFPMFLRFEIRFCFSYVNLFFVVVIEALIFML